VRLKLNQIETFTEIAKRRSFRAAGESLNITQPRVSARIHEMEEILGFKLFDRTAKGAILTEGGSSILSQCLEIVARTRTVERIAEELNQGSARRIRVGSCQIHG